MGVTFWGAAENNGNNTHLLLIMCARLSQKIGLHDLVNCSLFLNARDNIRELFASAVELVS